jgi:hypothetical protein
MAQFWRSQPPPGAVLDWTAAITSGMIFALAPAEGAGRSVANLVNPNESGTMSPVVPAWVRNDRGVAPRLAGGSGEYIGVAAGILRALKTGGEHRSTLELVCSLTATASFLCVIDFGAAGSVSTDRRYSVFLDGTANIYLDNGGSSLYTGITGVAWSANQRMTIHVTNENGATAIYLNGVQGGSGTWPITKEFHDREMRLSTNPTGGGGTGTVDYEQLIWWNRVLTRDELRERVSNPYGHYSAPFWRRLWVVQPPTGIILVNPAESETEASPITFQWRGAPGAVPQHYQIAVAADGTATSESQGFTTNELLKSSLVDSGFEYDTSAGDDGSGPWDPIPAGGLSTGNQGRLVRYQSSVTGGAKDWRVRALDVLT